jgi:two-component system OmpR family response regulator
MHATPDILLVEDDASVREAVVDYLGTHGLQVRAVADGAAMDLRLRERRPDLVVLDLMLPGEDGLSICRRLAAAGPPVLVVSALGAATDRIIGLELGAADYLGKPFEPRELLARIRAVLRRNRPPGAAPNAFEFADWRFDTDARCLQRADGSEVALTPGEAALLQVFVERPARTLTRQALLDLVHGDVEGPYDRAIDLAVSRLRRKLEGAGDGQAIETVRGAGYRFRLPVRRA